LYSVVPWLFSPVNSVDYVFNEFYKMVDSRGMITELNVSLLWHTKFGHVIKGDILTSTQNR
ncbi:hypothetical protein ACVUOP_005006, partial [Klebsiella oxytoca]